MYIDPSPVQPLRGHDHHNHRSSSYSRYSSQCPRNQPLFAKQPLILRHSLSSTKHSAVAQRDLTWSTVIFSKMIRSPPLFKLPESNCRDPNSRISSITLFKAVPNHPSW